MGESRRARIRRQRAQQRPRRLYWLHQKYVPSATASLHRGALCAELASRRATARRLRSTEIQSNNSNLTRRFRRHQRVSWPFKSTVVERIQSGATGRRLAGANSGSSAPTVPAHECRRFSVDVFGVRLNSTAMPEIPRTAWPSHLPRSQSEQPAGDIRAALWCPTLVVHQRTTD